MKQKRIENCTQCVNFSESKGTLRFSGEAERAIGYRALLELLAKNQGISIPKWCPLEDLLEGRLFG